MRMTTFATIAMCVLAATFAAPASAGKGIALNGPALDGQKVALPNWLVGTSEAAFSGDGIHFNGPALDGQKIGLPDRLAGTSEAWGRSLNGPKLDGQKAALPGGPVHVRR